MKKKKNKKKNKLLKRGLKMQKERKLSALEMEWARLVELDLRTFPGYPDIPDIERRRKMMIGGHRRLHEYNENIKRDPDDPLWEYCGNEKF